jgi:hypothetical protein
MGGWPRVRTVMTTLLRITLALALAAGCRDLSDRERPDASRPGDGPRADAPRPDATTDPTDGTPIRKPCTSNFGTALDTSYGRLDGILVAIVPPGTPGCHSDPRHVHLQIELANMVYDVAVNTDVDVLTTARDIAVDTTPWSAGWHTTLRFDYTAINVHSSDFATSADLVDDLVDELATVNHISIYSRGYGPDGTHLVHRNNGLDGAIVTRPKSSPPHVRMYRFANQSF